MPLYDFECEDCGAVKEYLVRSHTEAAPLCVHLAPNGRSRTLHRMTRLLSAPAHFSISGYSSQNGYSGIVDRDVHLRDHPTKRIHVTGNEHAFK